MIIWEAYSHKMFKKANDKKNGFRKKKPLFVLLSVTG